MDNEIRIMQEENPPMSVSAFGYEGAQLADAAGVTVQTGVTKYEYSTPDKRQRQQLVIHPPRERERERVRKRKVAIIVC